MTRRPGNVLAPVVAALLLLGLSGSMALRASSAADHFLPSLNVPRPALAESEPMLGPVPPRLSRRVVLVLIDGLRLRDSFGRPFLDALRRGGVDAAASSHFPTISRPNHVTAVTGVPPLLSGVRNNAYRWPVRLDSLMDRASAVGMESAYVGDYASGMAYMFTEDFQAIHYASWPKGLVKAGRLVLDQDYPLVVLLPGSVDEAGHAEGADSEAYRDAIDYVDGQLAEILADVDLELDTVVVTADHGHTDRGGHGGTETDVLEIPLILAGAGVRSGATLGDTELADVAPTVAALLGLPAPGHSVGRTLVDALELTPKTASTIRQADAVRLFRNRSLAAAAVKEAGPSIATGRLRGLVLIAVLVVLAIAALWGARKVGAAHIDWRVIAIAVPAFPVTYYALLEIVGQSLSLSAIPDRGETMSRLFDFGLMSTGVYVIAGWVALQGRVVLRDRLAAANGLAFCSTLAAALPAGILWAVFGTGPFVELPSSTMMVLVPAAYVAFATHVVGVTALLGLEIVVFFARAVDPRVRLRRLERAAERERRRLEKDA